MSKHKTLNTRVTEQTHDALAEVADRYGVSVAQVVRWAIAVYFDNEAPLAETATDAPTEVSDGE